MLDNLDLSNVVDHRYVTFEYYNSLLEEEKKENVLFFLSNGDIYKGKELYNQSILPVSELPSFPSPNKIYIHDMRLKYYSLEDSEWHNIPLKSSSEDDFDNPDSYVTVDGVKTFLNEYIQKYKESLIFDSLEKALAYAKDEKKSMPGEILSVLFNNEYIPCTITAKRELKAYSTGNIGSSSDIDVKSTATVTMGIDVNGLITSDVNISKREGNTLVAEGDGLYSQGTPIQVIF